MYGGMDHLHRNPHEEDGWAVIGVGTSQDVDGISAGQQIADTALANLDAGRPAWTLVFCGGRHQEQDLLRGLRSKLGDIDIVGGSAVGAITHPLLGYGGYECAAAVFSSELPKPSIVVERGLDVDEAEAGERLGAKLREVVGDGNTVLLFYDSIRSGPPPVLNVGSRLMDGIYAGLAGKPLTIVGAGMAGDLQLRRSYAFDGVSSAKQAVVAIALPPQFRSHTTIMHGCRPIGSFLEITRIDGPVVYELNGRPALEVLTEMFGQERPIAEDMNVSLSLTLGQKHGDPHAPYDESAYINRLIISTDREAGTITLFEADFSVGARVQIMLRDNETMVDSARERTRELVASVQPTKPSLALYVDCAGRTGAFSGADVEEAAAVRDALGAQTPLLGFYSGVEIAPLLGRSRPLDWTGVLTLLAIEDH